MDLVKIGFQINADGIGKANKEVDNLLNKVTRVSSKQLILKIKLDSSIQQVKKSLTELEKLRDKISNLNIKLSMVGYSQTKANLEKILSLKNSIKDIQIRFTTVGNILKVRDQLLALKDKIINIKIIVPTTELDNLKKKLDAIKNKTVNINIKLPKASDVDKLAKSLYKLTSKKVKIEIILTPDLTVLRQYADTIDRIRGNRSNIDLGLGGGGGSSGRSGSGLFDQTLGIAKYALLSTAIYGIIVGLKNLAVSFVETADEVTNLTQRLSIYLPVNMKANDVMSKLGDIAKQNRTSLSDTGKLFTQLLPPMNRIKGGVSETTAIVDSFGKAMLIGGANTKEAASATIQFGQAMASGKLAGDEFRSLAEASPRLLQAIADGAGIAAQKLKEMSAAGKLTSGLVSAALLDQFIQLQYEAAKMGQTISGAFNEGLVSYQLFVDKFNKQTGFTQGFVSAIRSAVSSLESFGAGFLASLKDGDSTLNSFISLLKVIGNLVGSLIKGFTDVVGWVVKGGESIGLWKAIFDSVKTAIIVVTDTLLKIPFVIANIGTRLVEQVLKRFERFIELAQKGLDLAGFDNTAAKLGKGLDDYRESNKAVYGVTEDIIFGWDLIGLGVKKSKDSTGDISIILDKLKGQNDNLVLQEQEKKAMTDKQYIAEYAKLLLQQNGVTVNAENLSLVKQQLDTIFKTTQEQAKQAKLQGEIQAKKDEAEAKAKKDAEKRKSDAEQDAIRIENTLKGYQEQIDYVRRLQGILQQGLSGDAAKIAAERDYQDAVIGTQVALDLVEAKRQQSLTEYNLDLEKEESLLQQISLLQDAGASYDQARALAQSGHLANELAMLALAYQITNEQKAKKLSLIDQARTQGDVNHFLQQGLSLEEATTEAVFARLKAVGMGLSKEQLALKQKIVEQQQLVKTRQTETAYLQDMSKLEKQKQLYVNAQADGYEKLAINMAIANKIAQNPDLSPAQARKLVEAEELVSYERELADLKRQTYIATLDESEVVKDLISSYATWDSVQVGIVAKQQKLLEVAKELSKERENQAKSPIGDFSNVDFNVFGDFGNPFQSALEGLNEFVVKSQESRSAMAALSSEIVRGRIKGLDVSDLEIEKNILLSKQESDRRKNIDKGITTTLSLTKSMFKEESKGYKVVSALEKVYQAQKIAFALWEKKDDIQKLALKLKSHVMDMLGFTTAATTKVAAQGAVNVAKGTEAVLSQGSGDPYTAFARMAAMIAVVAGLGISISGGIGGGSSGSVTPANDGTGTVFGDSTAQSESIKNSIELLSENSDLMLPLTSAMLRSLRNIESSLGGVANLIIRGDVGNIAGGLTYDEKLTGIVGKAFGVFEKVTNKLEGFGLTNFGLGTSIVGKLLGGIFGKTSAEVTGSGLFGGSQSLGNVMDGGFNLSQYADVTTTKKSWFSKKTSYSTQYQAASKELSDQFGLIFTNVYDSILSASSVLGRDENGVIQKLRDSIINIGKIDTKGKTGKEIQEALESVIGQQSDLIAKGAVGGLDDFQKVGEGYFETLMRVATGIETASYFTDRLNVTTIKYNDIINKQGDVAAEMVRQSVLLVEGNKNINGGFYDLVNTFDGTAEEITDFVFTLRDLQDQLFMTGKRGEYLTSAVILGAGGLDTLSSGLDAYFEMLSPAEQAAELTRRLTNEFAIFGKQLPSDVKAFRNLVSSIDISSEAGQKLYGQILALAPEFNDLQDSLKSANSDVNALVKSLRDLAEQARAARGETEQPRNLAYTRSQFESNSILAMQGDTKAAEKLLTLGKDLMGLSKTYSVTGSEYARDLALIQRAATVSAEIQEQGLGTTISTTLTPSGGSTVTPTITTTSSSTDAKIEALKADLNAALLAIAKSSQKTSDRLEAWDYGDRMLVRVEQDGANDRIPVTTT